MKKRTILLILVLLLSTILSGQETNKGTSMMNFLKIGVGPRATAMGEAFVAIADDASAIYWNPAGLGFMEKKALFAQTNQWIAESNLYFADVVIPIYGIGTLGASIYSLASGDIDETTLYEPEGTGRTFGASNVALGVSFARQLTDRFSAGMTFKVITESLYRESASTFALDVGSIFITNFLNDMRIGFSFSNFGGKALLSGADLIVIHDVAPYVPTNQPVEASLVTQSWDLPLIFRVGVATDVYETENIKLTAAAAVNDSRDFTPRYNFGAECKVVDIISIRGGYRVGCDEGGLTFGGGLNLETMGYKFNFDYSYGDQGRLGSVSLYSIGIEF
jgi:hypothetical protein